MAAGSNVTDSLGVDHTGQPTGTTTGAPTGLAIREGERTRSQAPGKAWPVEQR